MDRIEAEERDRMKKANPLLKVAKKGLGFRFLNVAKANDIDTVGDLLNMGRARFEKLRNMGKNCVEEVSQALENLYGIKQW
jgi:DNA-directed RNA polymerase alpha subunit